MKDLNLFSLLQPMIDKYFYNSFLLLGSVDLQEMKTDIRQHLIFSQLNPEE